jgi:CelD/BcsL family acetyltransferase involved in cellulose biosynthesis
VDDDHDPQGDGCLPHLPLILFEVGRNPSGADRFLKHLALDDPSWRQFVRSRPDATPFHDPDWAGLLAECYRLSGFEIVQTDASGSITAGIPLLAPLRLPGRERRLVSLPFTDALRPLVDRDDARTFVEAADAFRAECGAASIELRGELDGAQPLPVAAVTHDLQLSKDPEVVAQKFSKDRRRRIRIAERSSLQGRRAENERDLTEVFFDLHVATRRRLGVPPQPKRFFRLLWRRIIEPGGGFVLLIERDGVAVAGAVFLTGNGTMVYKYSAASPGRLHENPNDLMLWLAICAACEQGFRTFDFGRSELSGAGLRAFKSSWGAIEAPLVYTTIGTSARSGISEPPAVIGSVLRRAPTWVTRAVGEALYRYAA